MSFATPLGLLLLLGIPVVVAIHLLTKRAIRKEVPSLAVWRMVPAGRRKKWHLRLFRNLNLLLQILAVAALALAASGPQLPRPSLFGIDRAAIIIDRSASMNAVHDGTTRLEQAKRVALDLLDQMRDTATVYLLEAGSDISVSAGSAAGSPETRRLIDGVTPTDTSGAPREVLERARDLLGSGDASEIYFITDGAFRIDSAYLASFRNLTVRNVGVPAANRGITHFAYRETDGDAYQFFLEAGYWAGEAAAEGSAAGGFTGGAGSTDAAGAEPPQTAGSQPPAAPAQAETTLTVAAGEQVLLERALSVPAGGRNAITFELSEPLPARVTASLSGSDALAADDSVALTAGSVRPLRVLLVGQPSVFLRSFFRVHPRVALTTAGMLAGTAQPEAGSGAGESGGDAPAPGRDGSGAGAGESGGGTADGGSPGQAPDPAAFDLVVVNELPSLAAGEGAYLAINTPVSGLPVQRSGVAEDVGQINWRSEHPLLADIDLSDLSVYRGTRTSSAGGVTPIVSGSSGDLIFAYRSENLRVVSLQFSLLESNISLLSAFPVFLDNALAWLLPGGAVGGGSTHKTGTPLPLRSGAVPAVRVTAPDGTRYDVAGRESFHRTEQAGVYTIGYEEGSQREVAFNLLSPSESNIAPRLTLPANGESDSGNGDEAGYDDTLLATAALLVLIALLVFDLWIWRRERA